MRDGCGRRRPLVRVRLAGRRAFGVSTIMTADRGPDTDVTCNRTSVASGAKRPRVRPLMWWLVDRVGLVLAGVTIPLVTLLVYYTVSYHHLLVKGRWPLGAYEYDSVLGYRLSPGFSGRLLDDTFHVSTHELGYRVPVFADRVLLAPGGVMSLGCSFTYGDDVEAEQTFSYVVGERLGLPAYNYGVCAYSYATMILQLRRLQESGVLDRLRPGVLVLAVGDWLIARSFSPFMPSDDLQYAYPYFSVRDGEVEITQPPRVFSLAHLFELQRAYFPEGRRDVPLTPARFLLLAREIPRVLYANLLGNRQRGRLKGGPPVPSEVLYDFVLREVETVSIPAGMRLVVLWMPTLPEQIVDPALRVAVARHPGVDLVDGGEALRHDGVAADQYCCGHHPGPLAHQAYARAIADRISALAR
jgi:hypothetical protein